MAMDWHMLADGPTEQTLTDLRRRVRLLLSTYGEDKDKAQEMACEIINKVHNSLQESERTQTAPMEDEGMSKGMRERIEADAHAAARTGFPGIPLKPTAEY
eukprot:816565-Alexandrium_andersonii.AAC.1